MINKNIKISLLIVISIILSINLNVEKPSANVLSKIRVYLEKYIDKQVTGLEVSETGVITWIPLKDVDGYSIDRSESIDGEYKNIKIIGSRDVNKFIDETVEPGKTYYYRMNNYVFKNNECNWNTMSNSVSVKIQNIQVSNLSVSNTGIIKWNTVKGADGYSIDRSESIDGEYKNIKIIGSGDVNKFIDESAEPGKTYYYRMNNYNYSYGNYVWRTMSESINVKMINPQVQNLEVLKNGHISWSKVEGSDGYSIDRSESIDGIYENIAIITDANQTEFVDTTAKAGKTYYYRMNNYNYSYGNYVWRKMSSIVEATIIETKVSNVTISENGVISWTSVEGADGYSVDRSTSENGKYENIAIISGGNKSKFVDKEAEPGKIYYYRINNYNYVNNKCAWRTMSNVVKSPKIVESKVQDLKISENGIITWRKLSNVDGYSIDRSESINGPYKNIAILNQNSTSFVDTEVKAGKKYYYRMNNYNYIDNNCIWRTMSDVVSVNITSSINDMDGIVVEKYFAEGIEVYKLKLIEEINGQSFDIYDSTIQNRINKAIDKLKEREASFDNPVAIINPYGISTTSLYLYFKTEQNSKVQYTVSADGYDNFTQTLNNNGKNNLNNVHEYNLIGLIPGEKNTVLLELKDSSGKTIKNKKFTIIAPKSITNYPTRMETIEGESNTQLSDGLFVTLGTSGYEKGMFIFDDNGIMRNEIVFKGGRADNILFYQDTFITCNGNNEIIRMNALGKVVDRYVLGKYKLHHDIIIDNEKELILALVSDSSTNYIEDKVITIDIKTREVKELLDLGTLFPELKNLSENNDWIHINSIQLVDGNNLILSARQTSTIIKINNVYTKPEVAYLLGTDYTWKNTSYLKYFKLKQIGEFNLHAGQHTVTYLEDDSLPEGQYYLYMFNNNWWSTPNRSDLTTSPIKGTGTNKVAAENSYYYKYLIDEKNNTFKLVQSIAVPYSPIVSSAQILDDNIIVNSGVAQSMNVFDTSGNLIRSYKYEAKTGMAFKFCYRIFKKNFSGFWFE